MNYKATMIGITALAGVSSCQAQSLKESEVPAEVVSAFQEKFSQAKNVEWEKESDNELEAEFKHDGKEMSASFSNTGEWLETETEIKEKDLPRAVKDALKTQFVGYDIEESAQVSTPAQSEAYEVELEKGKATLEVVLDKSGKVLKQAITEGDEDNNGK